MRMSTSSTTTSGGIEVAEMEALPLSPNCAGGDDHPPTTSLPAGKIRRRSNTEGCFLRSVGRYPHASSIPGGHESRRKEASSSCCCVEDAKEESHETSMKVQHPLVYVAKSRLHPSSCRPATRLLGLLAGACLCLLVTMSAIRGPDGAGEHLFHSPGVGTGSIPWKSNALIIDEDAKRENEDPQNLRRRLFREIRSFGGGRSAGDTYRDEPDSQQQPKQRFSPYQPKQRFSPYRTLASWAEFPSTTTTNNDSSANLQPPSLFPLTSSDLWGLALAVVGLMLAAGGGVGGGGILVPIYTLVLRFTPRHAIPLSNVTVFGGAVANAILNSRKRHPYADRPLVDWDLMLVMEPLTICGALIGSFVNKMLPEILLLVSMVLLLSFTANNTLRKAKRMHEKETEDMKALVGMTMEADAECGRKADDVDGVHHHERKLHQEEKKEPLLPRQRSSSPVVATALAEPEKQNQRPNDGAEESSSTAPRSAALECGEQHGDANSHILTDSGTASKCRTTQQGDVELVEISNAQKDYRGDAGTKEKGEKVGGDDCGDTTVKQVHGQDTALCGLPYEPTGSKTTTNSGVVDLILEEERHSPPKNVGILCGMFLVVVIVNILKGGGAFSPLGIACGSTPFWIAEIFLVVWIFAVFAVARSYLVKRAELKRRVGYQYVEGDIEWTPQATVIYPAICWVAGFFAGMFGIGGGIVKGPLMLAMGIHPAVASATSACMILFTSLVATTSYAVFGLLIPDYAAACLVVGFVATLLGQKVMSALLKRHGRNSYIAFSIGIVVLLSAICMSADSVVSIIRERGLEAEGDEDAVGDAGGLCSIVE